MLHIFPITSAWLLLCLIYIIVSHHQGDPVLPSQIISLGTSLEPVKCLCMGSVARGRIIAGVGCRIQAVKVWPHLKKDSVVSWDTHSKGYVQMGIYT